jgi:hypothetical protein
VWVFWGGLARLSLVESGSLGLFDEVGDVGVVGIEGVYSGNDWFWVWFDLLGIADIVGDGQFVVVDEGVVVGVGQVHLLADGDKLWGGGNLELGNLVLVGFSVLGEEGIGF